MTMLGRALNLNLLLNMMLISAAVTVTIMFSKSIASILTLVETTCTVSPGKITYLPDNGSCPCGFFCRGEFPCVRLLVDYTASSSSSSSSSEPVKERPLHQNLHNMEAAPACAFSTLEPCSDTGAENTAWVESLVRRLKSAPFPCFYHPSNFSYVLLHHNPSPYEISLWMTICWASVALFGATSILLCWRLGACEFWRATAERVLPFENENTLEEKKERKRKMYLEEIKMKTMVREGGGDGGSGGGGKEENKEEVEV